MASKPILTAAFYMQLATISTIVVSSIFGFRYGVTVVCDLIEEKIKPLIARIEKIEDASEKDHNLLASNVEKTSAVFLSANLFIDSYNRTFHREFLRPVDVTTESIVTEKLKRK